MTRQQAHAQALNEAHVIFGGHETTPADWAKARAAWIAARERQLAAPDPTTGGNR
jgi:hypothetical protein